LVVLQIGKAKDLSAPLRIYVLRLKCKYACLTSLHATRSAHLIFRDFEEYYFLRCDTVWFGRNLSTFRKNVLPALTGSSEPNKQHAKRTLPTD
jgi:hypothetical protein